MAEDGLALAHTIVATLDEKKGEDILLLRLAEVCDFTDYFIICTGGSERTLRALVEEILERVRREHDLPAAHVEGEAESGWVLVDYGDVIVHLFSPPLRSYYRLEELWKEGQVLLRMP